MLKNSSKVPTILAKKLNDLEGRLRAQVAATAHPDAKTNQSPFIGIHMGVFAQYLATSPTLRACLQGQDAKLIHFSAIAGTFPIYLFSKIEDYITN